ncbi:HDOD domain-containing protein [Undibacterium flavidum]|uniref:HDOD domain-containing protein n=1 Tax=Undibacterium flavidum TaxID=2762297 RepID=A0ABR6Y883_9BURK|nr:HDOD domain-containing protein [Undibacterium flavidum]MBC3872823.1 HDOD domain-containing protein [Undibacterium flavidum]
MNKTEALDLLVEQALRDDLIFSASVATSLRVQEAIDVADCSLDTAAKIIMNEPLLAAKVVAVANSAAYNRGSNSVTNVRSAIARLGFNTLRALVASLVMRQIAGASKHPVIRAKINQLWEHSAQVAAIAQVLARRVTKLNPDTAMFAGIVHEVGGFYLLSRAEEFPCLLEPDDLSGASDDQNFDELETVSTDSQEAIIGRAVLKNLHLPSEVNDALEALWYGLRAMPPETLGDTLLLSNELARTLSPLDTRTDSETNRCESEIDFVVGEGTLLSILEESEDEVITLSAALII